jgi:hypothetical protein
VSVENGRKRVRRGVRRPISECDVLIKDHHEGYISWEDFERNQQVIADNAMSKGSAVVKGAVRKGEVLLAGLLRCGHCGRKLHVHYSSNIRPLYLLRRACEPRNREVHLDRQHQDRHGRQQRGPADRQAARNQRGLEGNRCSGS